jgi:tRNA (cmo5U34)-methyltransferase
MNEFDIKASAWDQNPMHWERSAAISNEIRNLIPVNNEMKALEYGAGTGIASFLLKDYLKEITLMDSSAEMVRITEGKIASTGVKNLKVLKLDLENESYTNGKFDLIFTQMVLHHVNDIDSIIEKFRSLLNPGGYLAVADLYEEDGSFHGEGFTGHNGFNIENLKGIIGKHSFGNIIHSTCFVIDRKVSETETKQYEVFLVIAKTV